MPICPQRRISKTRGRKRRTHYKITVPGLNVCPNCGDGKKVKNVKEKEEKEDK